MRVRSFFITLAAAAGIACPAIAGDYSVEFRPVLAAGETESAFFEVVAADGTSFKVHTLPYLADRDIKEVEAFKSATARGRLLVGFTFNDNGLRRFRHLIRTFREKRVAIFSGGKLVVISPVLPPEFMGERVVIAWPGTERDLRAFAARVNKKDPGLLELYIEEQGKYNDVAVEMWAAVYQNVNEYFEAKARQIASDASMVEAARDDE